MVSDVAGAIRGAGTGFEDAPNVKAFFDNAAEGVEELSADIGRRTVSELYDELDAAARRRPGLTLARGGCCRLRVVPTVDVVRCQADPAVPVSGPRRRVTCPRHRRPFMIKPRPRTVQSHLGDAIRETRELVSSKIVLFRAEMTSSLHHLTWALSLFIAAGVFAMAGVAVLILALVKGLAVLLHSEALSALVIGGVFAAIAISLALWGRSKASPSGLEPIRPEQQVRQNVALITERISG